MNSTSLSFDSIWLAVNVYLFIDSLAADLLEKKGCSKAQGLAQVPGSVGPNWALSGLGPPRCFSCCSPVRLSQLDLGL